MDKLKILSEMLLKISSVFPSGGNGQMLEQLQVRVAHLVTEGRGGSCPGVPTARVACRRPCGPLGHGFPGRLVTLAMCEKLL